MSSESHETFKPEPSAITRIISHIKSSSGDNISSNQTEIDTLSLEVLHNLRHQHGWTDLQMTQIPGIKPREPKTKSASSDDDNNDNVTLISGMPPRHMYIHPDLLNDMVKYNIKEDQLIIQKEWVVPMSIGEKWSLRRIGAIFDTLVERDPIQVTKGVQHQDHKRILLGMLGHNGVGGDGTIVYYIMQEGEVKPRQN